MTINETSDGEIREPLGPILTRIDIIDESPAGLKTISNRTGFERIN